MTDFKIGANSYERMPQFTKLLKNKGIDFSTSVPGQLTISVAEKDVEEFIRLANVNKVGIEQA
ncbi:hypothetical protein [Clostridium sp. AWRP]|uniref:hypothetical protein n=1 Tax=Clostridium sp. AWRP TaxID=2212991 RepID=UPI000FD91C1D|nr:hypothetical protein [Clostridium sp. AWRP]AZV56787.1 hypothetical protein DMR38_09340 [Clostridium sp. AWRP]